MNSEKIHIDLEDDDDVPSDAKPARGSSSETFEFNDFDAHINKKVNSELRKPKSIDKDEEIKNLKKQVQEL